MEVNPYLVVRGRDRAPDRDLAISAGNLVFGGSSQYALLSPASMLERVNRQIRDLAGYGAMGMTISGAGDFLYYDYNPTRQITRGGAINYWQAALANARSGLNDGLGYSATRGGNAYVLRYTDWLMDIPHSATGFIFTDESIPLFQMIVHGSIPFTGKPINLFHDPPSEILRMIEFGYTPLFSVVYGEPDFRVGFSSRYYNIRDMVISLSREYIYAFAPLAGQFMINHERTTGDAGQVLARVEYSLGWELLINYGNEAAQIDGILVPGLGYAVLDPSGNVYRMGAFNYEAQEIPEFEAAGEHGRVFVFSPLVLGLFGVLLLSAGVFLAARFRKNTGQPNLRDGVRGA